jgi:hypothetical protein
MPGDVPLAPYTCPDIEDNRRGGGPGKVMDTVTAPHTIARGSMKGLCITPLRADDPRGGRRRRGPRDLTRSPGEAQAEPGAPLKG